MQQDYLQYGERMVPMRSKDGFPNWFGGLCFAGLMLLACSQAQASERIISDPDYQVALFGYDPVAYLADGGPRLGLVDHEILHLGLVWRFANEGNLAAFLGDPERYVPAYGGHGAFMMARGTVASGHPEVSLVLGNRVFLFSDAAARYAFLLEADRLQRLADANWPDIERTLAP